MVAEGHTVASLTGGIEGTMRDKIIDDFREGRAKVLITTNVLARGIDVSTVSMVMNYVRDAMIADLGCITDLVSSQDIPEHFLPGQQRTADPQTYLHRIGRTGRFGRVGVAISFVSNKEEWQMLMNIQKYFHTTIEGINTRDWDEVESKLKKIIKNPRARGDFPMSIA
jgi:ATP-dependent RNA helicase DDX19/DBP5